MILFHLLAFSLRVCFEEPERKTERKRQRERERGREIAVTV